MHLKDKFLDNLSLYKNEIIMKKKNQISESNRYYNKKSFNSPPVTKLFQKTTIFMF